ncbi:MAG TPA: sterol desaturase family protein [Xanthomonadaceae bacterium]|nr:sterol desaturase family protein [Xanthomonadaceae bacterium]
MNAAGEFIIAHEAWLRFGGFAAVLGVLAIAERLRPLRGDTRPAHRQLVNLGLVLVDTAVLRLAFPLLAVALAIQVHARGGGLLGPLDWPGWLEIILAMLVFDLTIYWQHRLLHLLPWLWPLHRVHHSDLALDVSTGVRFHPLEIALSMVIKLSLVALLGPHPLAVVLFELLLSAGSLFTHADVALPARVERIVRRLIVTPSMHRIHHSLRREETDSNYGFNLSLWDHLFASYRPAPALPERGMPVGVPAFRDPATLGLWALLLQPFRRVANARDPHPEERIDA